MARGKYEKIPESKKNKKKNKKQNKKLLIVLWILLALLLVAIIAAVILYNDVLNNLGSFEDQETMSSEELAAYLSTMEGVELENDTPIVTEPSEFDVMSEDEEMIGGDIINIMLVGQDTRSAGQRGLSDTMILVSINRETKKLVITSFIRDLYIDIVGISGSGTYRDRLNTAYCTGGIGQLGDTLALNFGVEIDNFVEVDFSAFQVIVDTLGGIDMELTKAEAQYLNKGYRDQGWDLVEGMNHLNGAEALAYARIRAIDSDFYRTERQRKVINELFKKAKEMSLADMLDLAEEFLPMLTTDMTNMEITKYIVQVAPILPELEVESLRIPVDGTWGGKNVGTEEAPIYVIMCVDLSANRELLRNTIGEEPAEETTVPTE